MNKSKLILSAFATAILIAADQAIKYLIRVNGGFYICNKNFAFGLNKLAISILLFTVIILLIVSNFKNFNIKKLFENWKFPPKADQLWAEKIKNLDLFFIFATIFIFAGSFSNIIDRLTHGCVIDFIDLKFWPVFNLADIYISAGVILLLISVILSKHSEQENHNN